MIRRVAVGLSFLFVSGCSAPGDDPDPDPAPPPTCRVAPAVDETFELAPGAGPTQIQAKAAFDGGIWLTYLLPNDEGDFDVWLAHLECDGTVSAGPVRLDEDEANTGSPRVAVSGDRVLVAWHADTGEFPHNLTLRYRLVDRSSAAPLGPTRVLRTRRGEEEAGNTWLPAVAPRPGGGFVVAGARGVGAGGFQAFAVRMDEAGEVEGEAIDGHASDGETQVDPAVAVAADGAIHLAWTVMGDADVVHHVRVPPEAPVAEPAPPVRAVRHATSGGASLAADRVDPSRVHLAVHVGGADADVWLVAADLLDDDAPHFALVESGRTAFLPALAAGPDGGGAVAWHRNVSGLRNEVRVARVRRGTRHYDRVGEVVALPTDTAAPYPLTLVHLEDHRYFVAWSEGLSPELFLRGRIVDLE